MTHSTSARPVRKRNLRLIHIAATLPLAIAAVASPVRAQQSDTTASTARPLAPQSDSASAASAPPRRGTSNVRLAAGLAGAAVLVTPFDVVITKSLRSPSLQKSSAWRAGAVVFDWYGAPGSLVAGPVLAVAGSVFRSPTTSDIGIHISESYLTAALTTFIIKGIAGRARPYQVTGDAAYNFALGRGFPHREPYSSFPSGHATGSFAFASSITVEAAYRWPEHARLVGVLAYGGAFLDGVSRVYRDTHWPSDVAMGALVGTMSGILVTRHQHAHPNNTLDAIARRVLLAPSSDGRLAIGISNEF